MSQKDTNVLRDYLEETPIEDGHSYLSAKNAKEAFALLDKRFSEYHQPVAVDEKSQALLALALKVAQSDVGVMISGESGTGKEVIAQYIHSHSIRNKHPFIAINCAAIPDQMLEATLFGYEKGAFTGAYKSTPGKFEQAQSGSILLDEVSEMSMSLQAKLLRVLQEKEVERIGSNKVVHLDVRVLATSNRQLLDEVKRGRFREDLYYRLNIFPMHCLPLRDRANDIIPLANHLIRRHFKPRDQDPPRFGEDTMHRMTRYAWPGNVRELENVVQRAIVLNTDGMISPEELYLDAHHTVVKETLEVKKLQSHEFDIIVKALETYAGNRQKVATVLGVSERTLRYKLAKMREEGYLV